MSAANAAWWVVMVLNEEPTCTEVFGPFKSEQTANAMAAKWNSDNSSEAAQAAPVWPAAELAKTH